MTHEMIINGEPRAAASRFDVVDPATGAVFDTAPDCDRRTLDEAMASAALAFIGWREHDDSRRACLRMAASVLTSNAPQIASIVTAEQGKPLRLAVHEVLVAARWFDYYAEAEFAPEVVQDDHRGRVEVRRRPLGVVAAIAPWNFPVALACWKIAPALRAGNTVVVKPSPYTPLSTLATVALLNEAFPPGVLNCVSGGDRLGAWMTSHPVARKVSFTGSVATGQRVAASAGSDLKRLTLELGGNDAAILLDDVDLGAVASEIFWSAFTNSGQICVAIKRLYVPHRMRDDVCDALVDIASRAVVGDGRDDRTELGPVSNEPQLRRVASLVRDAVDKGAVTAVGGTTLDRPGYFYAPTILVNVAHGAPIVDEEQFGPALPIIGYDDLDLAVRCANASAFGLGASVWTSDVDRGERVARRLEAGTAWVNKHGGLQPELPFGGVKHSGLGVANGRWGYDSFTDVQVIHRVQR